jgi:hypothetical protein
VADSNRRPLISGIRHDYLLILLLRRGHSLPHRASYNRRTLLGDHDRRRGGVGRGDSQHHRDFDGVTPDASGNLRAFGGHSLLDSGTREHARAMFHDVGYFGGIDTVTFYPLSDIQWIPGHPQLLLASTGVVFCHMAASYSVAECVA